MGDRSVPRKGRALPRQEGAENLREELEVFEQRLGHTRQRELQLALNEIAAISRLRLARYLQEADPAPVCTH